MADYQFDLIVVGGGSGGVAAGRRAAEYGARVAVCEGDRYGGTCVHRGCIPKKLLVYAGGFAEQLALAEAYGWSIPTPVFDWKALIAAKDAELERLNGFYNRVLEDSGVRRVEGWARLLDGHTVEVGGERLTGRIILLAVGGKPWTPEGLEPCSITSDEAFHLEELPRRVLLVGSGYIGVEFAGIFNSLGCDTNMIFRSELVLPDFDCDVRSTLQEEMAKRGVRFYTGQRVTSAERTPSGYTVTTSTDERFEVDLIMAATGRTPNTRGIGLEEVGVKLDAGGAVVVDDHYRTTVDSIYAVGDCISKVALTPVAIAEGRALAETLFNDNPTSISYCHIPTAVFSMPEVGTVGMTQSQAVHECPEGVDVYRARFRPMKYTLPGKDTKMMLKLLVEPATDQVLGCHMVGEGAAELIQALAVTLVSGATKKDFDRTIAVHPTAAEEFVLMRRPSESLSHAKL